MKTFKVSEAYLTVQGEATNTGRPAVFVRMASCNLWNGRLTDRDRPACAAYCDVIALEDEEEGVAGRTSFAATNGPNGGKYTGAELRTMVQELWGSDRTPFVVLTGGEPTLQCNREMFAALSGFDVAVETNGTTDVELPFSWHVTVSPKGDYELKRRSGYELKLLFPQMEDAARPEVFERLARSGSIAFVRYYLQPIEPLPGPDHHEVWRLRSEAVARYVQENPFWRLSVQTHKMLRLP